LIPDSWVQSHWKEDNGLEADDGHGQFQSDFLMMLHGHGDYPYKQGKSRGWMAFRLLCSPGGSKSKGREVAFIPNHAGAERGRPERASARKFIWINARALLE
jgi:hypothetical protein